MMRVLVCGGRNFEDRATLYTALDRLRAVRNFDLVIAGGARGGDPLAADWAKERGLSTEIYVAEWDRLTPPRMRDLSRGPRI